MQTHVQDYGTDRLGIRTTFINRGPEQFELTTDEGIHQLLFRRFPSRKPTDMSDRLINAVDDTHEARIDVAKNLIERRPAAERRSA